MLITQSNLALTSEHHLQSSTSRLALARSDGSPNSFAHLFERELQAVPAELLQVEAPAAAAQTSAAATESQDNPFQAILEMLFGLPHAPNPAAAAVPDGAASSPEAAAPHTMQFWQLSHSSETESCTFAASGNICLADGSTRQFDVGYRMDRSEESTQIGLAQFKDPLVLDFGEVKNNLARHGIEFDLDSDGKTENLCLPTNNSAVLFCDRNHNGRADNGSELFGPRTGNGFGELAELDGDGNGWIDGGDAAFADLMLWQPADDDAGSVRSLAAAGIGALATANAETPFTLKEDGATLGQVRSSSVWLGEHSGAGIVRQIDVAVTPRHTQSA